MILVANRRPRTALLMIAALVALVITATCGNQKNDAPLIFAAASLADVLTEAADAYKDETGNGVEFNFGGSIALANQVARLNAPADGVILAGESPIDLLTEHGAIEEADVVVIARNTLVVVSADDRVLTTLSELALSDFRVAIADPELAPAGQYAKEALISAAVWNDISGQVIPTLDVRAALAAASSRSVDFAIVYATDALTETDLHVILEVDSKLHQLVSYPAAAISDSSQFKATNDFLDFLVGSAGEKVLQDHGFMVN